MLCNYSIIYTIPVYYTYILGNIIYSCQWISNGFSICIFVYSNTIFWTMRAEKGKTFRSLQTPVPLLSSPFFSSIFIISAVSAVSSDIGWSEASTATATIDNRTNGYFRILEHGRNDELRGIWENIPSDVERMKRSLLKITNDGHSCPIIERDSEDV